MKKILFFIFSLVLIFSFKVFADGFDGTVGLDVMSEPPVEAVVAAEGSLSEKEAREEDARN